MFEMLRNRFGKAVKAEYVDDGIKVHCTNPHNGELNWMLMENMIMQDLADYYNPRIPNGDKYHYLSDVQKEFLDTGVIR